VLNSGTILQLNDNVLKRFEHNLNDGVIFLFDVKTKNLWTGNVSANELIKQIDGTKTIDTIYTSLEATFTEFTHKEIIDSFDSIISNLLEEQFIKVIKN
jgi:hypothetical protein